MEHQSHCSGEINPERNIILTKHQVPPMIIVDHNRDHITNQIIITKVNNIVMIEQHKKFLPEMCMVGNMWIIKVSFIMVYQTLT